MAMASIRDALVERLLPPFIDRAIEYGIQRLKERWNLEDDVLKEIECLSEVLKPIKGFLEDAEKKQSEDSRVLVWLKELKEVLYDAEDLLDGYEVGLAPKNKTDAKNQVSSHFLFGLFSHQELSSDLSIAKQIESIKKKLDRKWEQGCKMGLRKIATSSTHASTAGTLERRETTSFLADDSTVVGRDDEKRAILEMLLDKSKKLSVLPIIGMGGVGKTTLAKLVYNDKNVVDFFKLKAWVCIGTNHDLNLKSLMILIINSICPDKNKSGNADCYTLDSLQKIIVEEIKDKKTFMLVLDDAWDSDVDKWNKLFEPLKAVGLTCRVIVTTRDHKVADAIRSDRLEPIRLDPLEENYMRSIFKRHAVGGGTDDIDSDLEDIGIQIVRRLKGLPLAAETVGGILRRNRDVRYWTEILETKLHEIEGQDPVLSILMLSYNSLHAILKQCFLYFSLFPKDYKFIFEIGDFKIPEHVGTLVSQVLYIWMSHRLTKIESTVAPEVIGKELITHLTDMSLLQSTTEIPRVPSITIHDLVHDLVEKIAKEEFFRGSDATENNLPKKLRHISFFEKDSDVKEISELEFSMLRDLERCTKLRTFIFSKFYKKVNDHETLLDGWFKSLTNLRVLSLHNEHMASLPDSIGNLKLLRYLDLDLPIMEKLPISISSLYSLQVLVLHGCLGLSMLDDSLTRLVNLVNLDFPRRLKTLKNIGKLTNLQQLRAFPVKRPDGHKVMELRNLNKICDSLCISSLQNIETKQEAEEAQLDKKVGLRKLELNWETFSTLEKEVQLDVLEGLRPSNKLDELFLTGYEGTYSPNWFNGGHLRLLKIIKLERCSNLEGIPSFSNCLEKLEIFYCPHLKEFPSLPSKLQHLSLFEVGVTSLSYSLSCKPSLRELIVSGCRDLDESLSRLLKSQLSSLVKLVISDYRHPLEAFCNLTALSDLNLNRCSGKVRIDIRALVSLKNLEIEYCPSATIENPHPNSTPCTSLDSLAIHDSPSLLKSLSQSKVLLSSLKYLDIANDDLNDSALSGCLRGLTALKNLSIHSCPNITSVPGKVLCTLVSMDTLAISYCYKLEDLDIPALRSLQWLDITRCPRLFNEVRPIHVSKRQRLGSSSNQLLLDVVRVHDSSGNQIAGLLSLLERCSNVKSITIGRGEIEEDLDEEGSPIPMTPWEFPSGLGGIGHLTRLEVLDVTGYDVCAGLPRKFPSLSFLRELRILDCADVTSFQPLNSLQILEIRDCPNFSFVESPPRPFPSLVRLDISSSDVQQLTHLIRRVRSSPLEELIVCTDLMSFDGELEIGLLSLTSLRKLEFDNCSRLQRLPSDLQGFKALRELSIIDCSEISSLPEKHLPTSLEKLYISDCPALKERYGQRDGNPHRQRISHILVIEIYEDQDI